MKCWGKKDEDDIFNVKEHIVFLWQHRRYEDKIPTIIDYIEALSLPPDHVISFYNELVIEGRIKGTIYNELRCIPA